MSVSARVKSSGTGPLPVLPSTNPVARDTVGLLFSRLTVLPALVVMPYLLVSFPLLLGGYFKSIPVIILSVLLAAVMVPWGWRRVPSLTGAPAWGTASADRAAHTRTPRWSLIALIAVSVGFGIFTTAYKSQFIMVMLDPASYMQFAAWIAQHGSLPIPQNAQDFGHIPGLNFNTPAFYQVGNSIVPQFMAGLPMVLSLGFWINGARAAVFFGPLLGTAAVFVFGGLAARLVGPRWAPVAALIMAVSLPQQYTSRSTFSEPLAQILFLGGLALWIDSQVANRGRQDQRRWSTSWRHHVRSDTHVLAFLAGLALGINLLVRLDGPSDMILLIPYTGYLIVRRYRQTGPLSVGVLIGLVYGVVDAVVLSWPYIQTNISSVKPLTAAFGGLTGLTALAVMLWLLYGPRLTLRYGERVLSLWRYVPRLIAVLPFLVLLVFVARPYVQKKWAADQFIQLALHWVYWYLGGPVILFATIAFAALGWLCVRGKAPVWALPLLVFGWTTTEFLYRPAIVPHQPWASRRIVPAIEPGLILLSLWLAAWAVRKMRASRFSVPRALQWVPVTGLAAVCAAVLVAPAAQTEFGLNLTHGKQGVRLVSDGLAFKPTNVGEIYAIDQICKAIPRDSSVLIIDQRLMGEMAEAIRGMCGVPTAGSWPQAPTTAQDLADVHAMEQTGRHVVVLGAYNSEIDRLPPGHVTTIMSLYTHIDETLIYSAPHDTIYKHYVIYMWEPNK